MNEHYEKIKSFFREKSRSKGKWKDWLRKYYYEDLERFLRFLIPQNSTILEIGCNDGALAKTLQAREFTGAYLSHELIPTPNQDNQANFPVCLPEEVGTLDKKFETILFYNCLGYLHDVQQVLRESKKLCRNETRLIFTYYNHLWEPILNGAEKLHWKAALPLPQNWLSFADLENLLALSGFEVVKKFERMLLPIYIPGISELFNRFICFLPFFNKLCLTHVLVAKPKAMEKKEYSVSVIIPARNEAGTVEEAVQTVPAMGKHTEIIFVEGNSTDNTQAEIKRLLLKYPQKDLKLFVQEGVGKGDATRKGFDQANGDILMILDADLSVRPEELSKFYDALASGQGEFINGSRLVYPLEKQAMRVLNLIANQLFSLAFSWLLNQRLGDTLCGTKVLLRTDYEKMKRDRQFFGDFDPFGDFDLIFGAAKLNLKIVEIPIRYRERKYGQTNIQRFRHGWLLAKMFVFASKKMKFV